LHNVPDTGSSQRRISFRDGKSSVSRSVSGHGISRTENCDYRLGFGPCTSAGAEAPVSKRDGSARLKSRPDSCPLNSEVFSSREAVFHAMSPPRGSAHCYRAERGLTPTANSKCRPPRLPNRQL